MKSTVWVGPERINYIKDSSVVLGNQTASNLKTNFLNIPTVNSNMNNSLKVSKAIRMEYLNYVHYTPKISE